MMPKETENSVKVKEQGPARAGVLIEMKQESRNSSIPEKYSSFEIL